MAILLPLHVAISVVGLGSGFVVLAGLMRGQRLDGWTALFLGSTLLTSLSGFPLPADHLMPSHIVGVISVVVLVVAIVARYPRGLAGPWRSIYVVTALIALYLNVFVAVVQAFLKVPALTALAPTQSEPPFAVAQLIVLALFVALTVAAARRFRSTLVLR